MIPASAPAYVTTPTSPPKHATIDDNTGYAVLPVDPSRAAYRGPLGWASFSGSP